jgi:Ca2+-binding EF-hand superfamily protein
MSINGGSKEFWEEIFHLFAKHNGTRVNYKDFIINYGLLLKGTTEEKLAWAFKMFDTKQRGYLENKEISELLLFLFTCESRHAPQAQGPVPRKKSSFRQAINLSGTAEQLMRDMDRDGDGKVTREEFIAACTNNEGIARAFESALERLIEVSPQGTTVEIFADQVAGHKKAGTGIMKQGDKLFKPFGAREFEFYESLKDWPRVPRFFPQYFGRTQVLVHQTGPSPSSAEQTLVNHFLILEDFTQGYKKPCICDLKIGRRTTEEDASLFKRMQMKTVDTISTSAQLGFRICGMRVYNTAREEYVVKDKLWGGLLSANGIREALLLFVNNGREIRYDVLRAFIPLVDEVLTWFKTENHMMRFVGSSILLIYDAEDKQWGILPHHRHLHHVPSRRRSEPRPHHERVNTHSEDGPHTTREMYSDESESGDAVSLPNHLSSPPNTRDSDSWSTVSDSPLPSPRTSDGSKPTLSNHRSSPQQSAHESNTNHIPALVDLREQISSLGQSASNEASVSPRSRARAASNSHKPFARSNAQKLRVGLVDFAHTSALQEDQTDDDYIYGAENLLTILGQLCTEEKDKTFEELWVTELRRARRGVVVRIENKTSKTLELVTKTLLGEHQVWGAKPRQEIPPFSTMVCGTHGENNVSGTHATLEYLIKDPAADTPAKQCRFVAEWENSIGLFARRVFICKLHAGDEADPTAYDTSTRTATGLLLYRVGGDCTEATFTVTELTRPSTATAEVKQE